MPNGDELRGDVWQLKALGGSGFYNWKSSDPDYAAVTSTGLTKARMVGHSTVTVEDQQNNRNFATILVEVKPIHTFSWVEEHAEIEKSHSDVVSLIAHDGSGRKFTNCTSVGVRFNVLNEGIISLNKDEQSPSYYDVRLYVRKSQDLLKIRQLFDE